MDGIIIVNKPAGYTSHDIVNKLRRCLKTKKVGHAGTLDPDATGVLVVCVNKATKVLQFLESDTKEYECVLSLGVSTDTYDASGEILETKEFMGLEDSTIQTTFDGFLGAQLQVPPIYSAIKVNGKKAYEYAREGKELVLEPRPIVIHSLEIKKIAGNEITFQTLCSKGTYIRSLCVDLAKAMGYPGHMKQLSRSQSGIFSLEDAYTLEEIEAGNFSFCTIEKALSHFPTMILEDPTLAYHGKLIPSEKQEVTVIKDGDEKVVAVYGPSHPGYLKSIRGLW
ncbi:tRNA pseudouridine(55) synthase TruB [Tannockella kyphosi]|uniref:tRNA pseudouridine(55) synthase TruB n=1 Tax=Tannockella kyphosi TaxID=2899121 RepID=UPI0020113995|nr:tRNA pseudouridine(55) synthase TruB [Tannockella kyphosi]